MKYLRYYGKLLILGSCIVEQKYTREGYITVLRFLGGKGGTSSLDDTLYKIDTSVEEFEEFLSSDLKGIECKFIQIDPC